MSLFNLSLQHQNIEGHFSRWKKMIDRLVKLFILINVQPFVGPAEI